MLFATGLSQRSVAVTCTVVEEPALTVMLLVGSLTVIFATDEVCAKMRSVVLAGMLNLVTEDTTVRASISIVSG